MKRALYAIFLSLVLVVTSQSAAMARGSATAVDQIVICSGSTVVTVFVDSDGQPTTAPHLCPDCALHLLAAVIPPAAVATPLFRGTTYVARPAGAAHDGNAVPSPSARAPPVSV
ncbi:hypothetical protein [Tateyamaria omphalii]|uniref:DUF2946 domain-containing protein n=1 Tax=Tateyamaria omphalii TaxID=299262 RepID=A0A1P8MZV9_9RHOB|nr:hypothetical protein [Tateyamaria omphalii]APX13616.1 hypothetical protein BWR18_01410 [Tateyamaria omphalii]